jgi:hypothetical protein
MPLSDGEQGRLSELEAEFEAAGGRGVELADRIDELRRQRDAVSWEVSVHNSFDAVDAEDAVRQMVEWLQENAAGTGYRARREGSDESVFIDADDIDFDDFFYEPGA